jgi:Tfp pilus assembly protein PilN
MRFDYLHSARPLFVTRLLETRIPERLQSAVFALTGAVCIVGGAWAIDAYRLTQALRIEAVYQQRFEVTQAQLRRTNVYYDRVRTLVDLDKQVRHIAESGDADARMLAEIANDLPEHAWLTGISHDDTGLALEGRAKNLQVVSNVLSGLMHARHLHSPQLVSAAEEEAHGQDRGMKYEIHVDGAAR